MFGCGEGLDFFEELVQPWDVVGKEDATAFDEGQDGVGTGDLVGCVAGASELVGDDGEAGFAA